MKIVNRLLRKNLSAAQLIGFTLSNFIGLAIVVAGVQFFEDVRSIWQDEDSFIKKDYLVVNKKVTSANTLGIDSSGFTDADIADLKAQPWVRSLGSFVSNDYKVTARLQQGGSSMSTSMFFEAIPSQYIDVDKSEWVYEPGSAVVPIIMSKDYLTLYNFGFASSAGLPQLSEGVMGSIPVQLNLSSEDGTRNGTFAGRIVGFSNRLNTILVPEEFMTWSNEAFGNGATDAAPSRLIVDVSSPGDVAIAKYLDAHDMEQAGENRGSQASYLLNIVTGIILGVGSVITVLSFFILMLSISLLMQKNRDKLHALIMLGFDLKAVGAPYRRLIALACGVSLVLALAAMFIFRAMYMPSIAPLTDGGGNVWAAPCLGVALTLIIIGFNMVAVNRKVASAFR